MLFIKRKSTRVQNLFDRYCAYALPPQQVRAQCMVAVTRNACLLVHEMACETDAFFNFFFWS